MKKRNKYWEKEKKYWEIRKALDLNKKTQRALGWVELENPIPHGYNAYFVLRKDISAREDAWIFQSILNLCAKSAWRRKNDFEKVKERKTNYKYGSRVRVVDSYPELWSINEETYSKLVPAIQKWFTETINSWNNKIYDSSVPSFFFEIEVKQHYKTKVKIIDELLLQEESELYDQLDRFVGMKYGRFCKERGAPKDFVRFFNVSHRRSEKVITKKIVKNTKISFGYFEDPLEDYTFPISNRHTASWSWW
jgi:hypothetical protein